MSSKIQHYCDRCGKEIAFSNLWDFCFKWEGKFALKYSKPDWSGFFEEIELCPKCGEEFELFLKKDKDKE